MRPVLLSDTVYTDSFTAYKPVRVRNTKLRSGTG